MTDLGTLGGTVSYGYGINDAGQVVGQSVTADDGVYHAFLFSEGTMIDLGTLGGLMSYAYSINDAGQVVGSSYVGEIGEHAFLYSEGTMIDLNSLLPEGSGWELWEARDINNNGQIVGTGMFDGQSHAFLLTPDATAVPEPACSVLLTLGAVGVAFGVVRRKRRRVV